MLLMHGRFAAVSACVVVLLTTCTCSTPSPDNDAGSDAGRGWLDSGSRDAARPDATRDVGRDAPEDAPRDGGPNDPEWVRLGGQPEGVDLYVARHPERVLNVPWESCGSGCQRAVCDHRTCNFVSAWAEEDRLVARLQNADSLQTGMLLDIPSGQPFAAWRLWDTVAPEGRLTTPSFGGGRVGIAAYADQGPNTLVSIWVHDDAALVDGLLPMFQEESPGRSRSIDALLLSATHYAFGSAPDNSLFVRDESETTARMNGPAAPGLLIPVRLVGDRLYFERWLAFEGPVVVSTGTIEEGPSDLIDVRPAQLREFHTDGVTMTWYQVYDYDPAAGRPGRFELWTSPLAARPEDVQPRRVRGVAGYYRGEVGGHWYVSQAAGYELDIYDLNDGSRRHWEAPDGNNILEAPLYVTDDEILVTSSRNAYRIDPNSIPIVDP